MSSYKLDPGGPVELKVCRHNSGNIFYLLSDANLPSECSFIECVKASICKRQSTLLQVFKFPYLFSKEASSDPDSNNIEHEIVFGEFDYHALVGESRSGDIFFCNMETISPITRGVAIVVEDKSKKCRL